MNVEVLPYQSNWPQVFQQEALLIQNAIVTIEIHHIGSTAIPGMSAKPIIDIIPVVKEIQAVDTNAMVKLGYEAKGENGMAFRRFFQKKGFNVHIFEAGDPEIERHLKFRDWMRAHEDDAQAYAKLKRELAAKFPHDILNYCLGKDAFVATIDAKDGYHGWRMVQALTEREWSAVRRLDPGPHEKDQIHFVLYVDADIIGYLRLQLLPDDRAAMRNLVIDERYRNRGYEDLLLKQGERWLTHNS